MAVMKRATKRLHDAGLTTLEVHKGLYGYTCRDKRFKRQSGTVFRESVEQLVQAVLVDGYRPKEIKEG